MQIYKEDEKNIDIEKENILIYRIAIGGIILLLIGIFTPVIYYPIIGSAAPINFQGFWIDLVVVCIFSLIILYLWFKAEY